MKMNIVCIPGDGIGPEIVAQARAVLDSVADIYEIGRASCRERV